MNSILLMAQMNGGKASGGSSVSYIVLMVVLVGLMYFMMIRPQKKRQKEEQEMRSSLEIGDEIITIGGIVGKVVTIREEDIVIETGADRTKMKIQRWAINTNKTKMDQHQKEVDAAREAAKSKKGKKSDKTEEISSKTDTAKAAEEKIEK